MDLDSAKAQLDKVIKKARVHLYKPIQIAEILYRDRVYKDIDLSDLESYRTESRRWRDLVCIRFLGRTSTSSARYQDDLFNENALPPEAIAVLGEENRKKNGIVEAYIYKKFSERYNQMNSALKYCLSHNREDFSLEAFISLFRKEPGLKRSIDKIYEIVVYALFSTLVEALQVKINIGISNEKIELLKEFEDFARRVINISPEESVKELSAKIFRVGVTNAADRGLDMWANFGLAIQIKHLSLNEDIAESIINTVTADRIVIVCKDAEHKIIASLLSQIGWRGRIQSIITEKDLENWYERALRQSKYSEEIGEMILARLINEIKVEFPTSDKADFEHFFCKERAYHLLKDKLWL